MSGDSTVVPEGAVTIVPILPPQDAAPPQRSGLLLSQNHP